MGSYHRALHSQGLLAEQLTGVDDCFNAHLWLCSTIGAVPSCWYQQPGHSLQAPRANKASRSACGISIEYNKQYPKLRYPSSCRSYETSRLIKTILTRQAVKTVLNYLSETNGELHYFLHNYVSENPIPLSGDTDADAWLVALASSPLTSVQDPRRSSVASVAAAAAVTQGKREVSPR